jgi:hypothetical protein
MCPQSAPRKPRLFVALTPPDAVVEELRLALFDSSETVLLSPVAFLDCHCAQDVGVQAPLAGPQVMMSPVVPVNLPSTRDTNCWLACSVKSFQIGIDTRSGTNWLAEVFSAVVAVGPAGHAGLLRRIPDPKAGRHPLEA